MLKEMKGPSIDWNNYLKDYEIFAYFTNLETPLGLVNKMLLNNRLELNGRDKNEVIDNLQYWLDNTKFDKNLQPVYEDKVTDFYHLLRGNVLKTIELNPNFEIKDLNLPNTYFIDNDTKGLYNKLKSLLKSKARLRETDLKLGVIDKEKYDKDNEIDYVILKYAETRLNNYKEFEKSLKNESKEILLEKGRTDLLRKTKTQSKARWDKRMNYKNFTIKNVDITDLLDKDKVVVIFEVGDYTDTIAFSNILLNLREIVKNDPRHIVKFDWVIKACQKALDQADIYVHCTCLAPDTQIKLLNGKTVTIKEMEQMYKNNQEMWVYSVDDNGDFKPGKVNKVWMTRKVNELIEVELDNGEKIKTTDNHLYMLRNGSYVRADELHEGMSLMPLYLLNNLNYANGYEQVKLNSYKDKTKYSSVYKIVAESYFNDSDYQEAKDRSKEDCIVIHHKDFNKSNNYPSNFKLMGKVEHLLYHGEIMREKWKNKDFRKMQSKKAKERMIKLNNNPTDKMIKSRQENVKYLREYWKILGNQEKLNNINSKAQKELWANYTDEEKENRLKNHGMHKQENRNKVSVSNKKVWDSYTKEEKIKRKQKMIKNLNGEDGLKVVKIKMKKTLDKMINDNVELTLENYLKYKDKFTSKPEKCFNDFNDMLNYFGIKTNYNHKVKSIKRIKLEKPIEVYDISVEKYNNFMVNAGVILHNCADFKYRFAYVGTKNNYKYGKKEMRPADVRNPNDDIGAFCKHLTAILSNKNWVNKVATRVTDWLNMQTIEEVRDALNYQEAEFPADIARKLGKAGQQGYKNKKAQREREIQNNSNNDEELELKDSKTEV